MRDGATITACLTPPGTGAIATLALRGPDAWAAVIASFQPASKRPLPQQPPPVGTVWFGRFGDPSLADEVVLTVKQLEPTFWLEIHSHGGPQVVAWLIETLQRRGIEPRSWQEFLSEVEPPWRAAALQLLAQTSTARTAAILLDQVNGAFQRAVERIRDNWKASRVDAALEQIDDLLRFAPLGSHLVEPWRVVVAGAPNAGKSTLVNALAGFQRSVVAPVPGTTRDVVSTRLAIDGWPVELLDTAGIRDAATGLERAGIDAARGVVESADLCLWLVDAAAKAPVWPEKTSTPMIVVLNKCDLSGSPTQSEPADLRISAKTGQGIDQLLGRISSKLVPAPPSVGAGVPYLPPQSANLAALRAAIESRESAIVNQSLRELGI